MDFPHNGKYFRLKDLLEAQDGLVYWRNNNSIRTGDTVFIYGTAPEFRIKYVMEVIEDSVPTAELKLDQSRFREHASDWQRAQQIPKYCLLKLKQVIPDDRLSWVNLQQHGLDGIIQRQCRVKDELLEFVLEETGRK